MSVQKTWQFTYFATVNQFTIIKREYNKHMYQL